MHRNAMTKDTRNGDAFFNLTLHKAPLSFSCLRVHQIPFVERMDASCKLQSEVDTGIFVQIINTTTSHQAGKIEALGISFKVSTQVQRPATWKTKKTIYCKICQLALLFKSANHYYANNFLRFQGNGHV